MTFSLAKLHAALGIDAALLRKRRLPRHREARRLQPVGIGSDGRDKFLIADAARAWQAMRDAAAADGIELLLISAFRSVEFQAALIRNKLARGMTIAAILQVNAPPGYSEHHSGRAVDIGVRASCHYSPGRSGKVVRVLGHPRTDRHGSKVHNARDPADGRRT